MHTWSTVQLTDSNNCALTLVMHSPACDSPANMLCGYRGCIHFTVGYSYYNSLQSQLHINYFMSPHISSEFGSDFQYDCAAASKTFFINK